VQRLQPIHPRCGTPSALGDGDRDLRVRVLRAARLVLADRDAILMLPVIAGIAYELIRFAASTRTTRSDDAARARACWLQRLTTASRSLDQLEVSIRALKEVLALEGRTDPNERKVEVMA
jgi:uncharacterized protein YqhQ